MSETSLQAQLEAVLARLAELEKRVLEQEQEIARKDQKIAALEQRLFGKTSERLDPNQEQLDFSDEMMGKPEAPDGPSDPAQDLEADEAVPEDAEPKRKRRRKADLFPRNLMVRIKEVIIPEEVLANPDAYREIDERHHDELNVTRSSLFWDRIVTKTFVAKDEPTAPPVTTPAPEPSVPGTLAAPALIAQIVVDKYVDHLPHYRQSARFYRRHDAQLSRQTLNGWTHALADYLAPIADAVLTELLSMRVVQIDETPIEYLQPGAGKTGKGYLWPVLDPLSGTVHYSWCLGRGHEHLVEILKLDQPGGFEGTIQCDGYGAYETLANRYPEIQLGGCLAHIRRKFFESRQQAPEVVMPILGTIQQLYRIEEALRQSGAPPDCRELVRRLRSRPLVETLYQKIVAERSCHLPQSQLGRALSYALGQWPSFERYLIDGALEIDNNLVENAIRPTKLGAKNYLFFGSANAGENSARLYTLMANCAVQGIDPERYLVEVIERMNPRLTASEAGELTPAKIAAEWSAAAAATTPELATPTKSLATGDRAA